MPKINPQTSSRVERAFLHHKKHPTLTVPQLMKLADFSKREREDHAIRMCIYRRIQKFALTRIETNLPIPNRVMCIAENGTLSSVTESCDTPPQTKVKRVRMTAHGAQTVRQAHNKKLSNYKIAFKHATTVYSREKEKKGGLLAQDVSDLIKNQFKESISARTIQRNIENGQVGSSPIRRGPMAMMNQTCCSMRFKQQTILLSTISFKLGMMPNILQQR